MLFRSSITGARGVLFNVTGGPDLTMWEINEAAKVITESIDKEAKVIFGAVQSESVKKGEIKITVIATGFSQDSPSKSADDVIELTPEPTYESKRPQWTPRTISQPEDDAWEAPAFLRRKR